MNESSTCDNKNCCNCGNRIRCHYINIRRQKEKLPLITFSIACWIAENVTDKCN